MKHRVLSLALTLMLCLSLLPAGALAAEDAADLLAAAEAAVEETEEAAVEEEAVAEEVTAETLATDGAVSEAPGYGSETENGGTLVDPAVSVSVNDETWFPDEIFRNYLAEHVDTDKDTWLSTEEMEAVRYIDFSEHTDYNHLESLVGIERFPNLNTLYMNHCSVDELDLSNNTELYRLECQNNGLTKLDLTGCSSLMYLECSGNKLTELDLSACTSLRQVNCSSNHDLTELDVSNCSAIKNAVEFGDEQTWEGFRKFYLENSYYGDQWLWIDSDVGIIGAVAAESGIYISKESFKDDNFRTSVTNLYDKSPANGWLTEKEIANVTSIDLGMHVKDATGIEYFKYLTSFSCYNGACKSLDLTANTELTSVYISGCSNLTELKVQGLPKLESLTIYGTALEELDVSGATALKELNCFPAYFVSDSTVTLKKLNVTGCTALEELDASGNDIESINLTGCTALTVLDVTGNALKELDVSDCTALEELHCRANSLEALDVSMLENLKELECGGNNIKKLDISKCTQLEHLECAENQLTALDVRGMDKLEYLYCYDNGLTALNLAGCDSLRWMIAGNNAFESLDISDCPGLITAVEKGEISGSSDEESPDIHFDYSGDDIRAYFSLDYKVDILGAEMPAGYLINSVYFPDSGFRSAVSHALGVREYRFATEEQFLNCTVISEGMYGDTKDLTGLELFPNLLELDCSWTEVEKIDLSLVPKLTTLRVADTNIKELDLTPVPGLTSLDITWTGIEKLDLSCVPELTMLDCAGTPVMNLDLTENKALLARLSGEYYVDEQGYEFEDGTVEIYLEYYDENGELVLCCHEDAVITPAADEWGSYAPGGETPEEPVPGDVDDDGTVEVQDLVVLMKSVIGDGAVNEQAADINGDDVVDILDVIALVRMLAGEYPTTG